MRRALGALLLLGCAGCALLLTDYAEPVHDADAAAQDAAEPIPDAISAEEDASARVDAAPIVSENLDWAGGRVPADRPTGLERMGDVVADSVTGLSWHAAASEPFVHASLDAYCEDSTVGGFSDWRAPRWIELSGIVDYSSTSPARDPAVFTGPVLGFVWSASAIYSPALRAAFTAGDGRLTFIAPSQPAAVARCVRGAAGSGTAPAVRYEIAADVVTDLRTGLAWQRKPDAALHLYEDARAGCTNVSLDGNGWRIPTIKELHTLLDLATTLPTRWYVPAFGAASTRETWSSTQRVGAVGEHWHLDFGTGTQSSDVGASHTYAVRCVRSI